MYRNQSRITYLLFMLFMYSSRNVCAMCVRINGPFVCIKARAVLLTAGYIGDEDGIQTHACLDEGQKRALFLHVTGMDAQENYFTLAADAESATFEATV